MNADRFLHLAQQLYDESATDPAALRSAVSRAYYAVFHVAKEVQEALDARPGALHELVGERFRQCSEPDVSGMGDRLASLRQRRNDADYKLVGGAARRIEDPGTVCGILNDAWTLLEEVTALPGGPHETAARAAITACDEIWTPSRR